MWLDQKIKINQFILIVLFFSAPPRLKDDDPMVESITVKAGPKSKLKLRCRMQGDPRPYTVWYKNGKRLQTRDNDR